MSSQCLQYWQGEKTMPFREYSQLIFSWHSVEFVTLSSGLSVSNGAGLLAKSIGSICLTTNGIFLPFFTILLFSYFKQLFFTFLGGLLDYICRCHIFQTFYISIFSHFSSNLSHFYIFFSKRNFTISSWTKSQIKLARKYKNKMNERWLGLQIYLDSKLH